MKKLKMLLATVFLTMSLCIGAVSFADTADGEVKLWTVSDAVTHDEAINLTGYQIYETGTVVKATSYSDNKTYTLTVLEGDEDNGSYMTAKLPLTAPNGLFDIWVENSHGTTDSLVLNGPRVSWATDDTIYAGITVYITGRNFDANEYGLTDVKPVVRLVSTTNANTKYNATVIDNECNAYKIAITVPTTVPQGEYYVEVSMGTYDVWSRTDTTQTLKVVAKDTTMLTSQGYQQYAPHINTTWEQNINWNNVVNVAELGGIQVGVASNASDAITKGKANANAINTALNALKVQENGGVLYFPNGDYLIDTTIYFYSNIAIVGESQNGTKLHFINGYYDPNGGALAINRAYRHYNNGFRAYTSGVIHDFGLYRLTIDSLGVDGGVLTYNGAMPDMFIVFSSSYGLYNGFCSNVTVRGADHYYNDIYDRDKNGNPNVNRRGVAFNLSVSDKDNPSVEYDGYYYAGGHIYMSDCDFSGIAGGPLQLYSREYLTMVNNSFSYARAAMSSYTAYTYMYGNTVDGNSENRVELPSGKIKSATQNSVTIDVTPEEQAMFGNVEGVLYLTVQYPAGAIKTVEIAKSHITFSNGTATLPVVDPNDATAVLASSAFTTIPTSDDSYVLRDSVDIHGIMHRSYAYFEKNNVLDVYDLRNVGEAICAEICESYSYGRVISATPNTVTVTVNGGPVDNISIKQGRLTVYISTGKGAGQTRVVDPENIVLDGETATITIEGTWDVIPDATSAYTLQEACEDITYYDNYINGSTKGILMYCNYNDAVAVNNEILNSAGIGIFSVRVPTTANYYDEDADTWYFNPKVSYADEDTEKENPIYSTQHARYNTNSRIRVEDNDISGVSPITYICGIRLRAEQSRNDGLTDLIQNTGIEIRNNTIEAGGYWGTADGKYVNHSTAQGDYEWIPTNVENYTHERQNITTDEVCIYVNGTIVQISGIAMGLSTQSVNDDSIVNQNVIVQGNTITGAISGVFVGQSVRGVVILDNDFTSCTYDLEIDARGKSGTNVVDHKESVKDVAYYSNTDTVRYRFNGSEVNAISNMSNKYMSIVFPKYVIYYVDGATTVGTQEYAYGATITPYTAPSKANYLFVEWEELPTTMPRQDIVISAKYVSATAKFTITYLDGTTTVGTQEYTYGATITPATAPSKTGKTFDKWDGLPATMPAKDITVNAVYKTSKVTVTYQYTYFDITTGQNTTTVARTRSLDYGTTLSYGNTTVSITGYTFSGWTGVAEGTTLTSNIVLNATMTPHTHTLTFKINGEEYESNSVAYGTAITLPEYTPQEGEVFDEWQDVPAYMPDYDLEIDAVSHIYYTIRFMKDKNTLYREIQVEKDTTITAPTTKPTKDGYVFDMWVGYTTGMTATGDATFYAKYTEQPKSGGCGGAIAMLSAFMGIIALAIVGKKY